MYYVGSLGRRTMKIKSSLPPGARLLYTAEQLSCRLQEVCCSVIHELPAGKMTLVYQKLGGNIGCWKDLHALATVG